MFKKQFNILISKLFVAVLFFVIACVQLGKAQNLPVHEQYMFDYMLVNPAFTGISDMMNVKVAHRQQWLGFDEAPNTSFLLFKTRVRNKNVGLGAYLYTDRNGANLQQGAQLSWSYHILLSSSRYVRSMLSFGLSLKGAFHILDETIFDENIYDPLLTYGRRSAFIPDANAGVIYSYSSFFIGASVDNLLPVQNNLYVSEEEPTKKILLNVHTGYAVKLQDEIRLKPSVLYKSNFGGLSQLDINLKLAVKSGKKAKSIYLRSPNEFWIGVSYRQTLDTKNYVPLSISPAIGFNVGSFSMMYLLDYGLASIRSYHYGTHQISVGVKLFHDKYVNWGKHNIPIFDEEF